MESNFLTTPKAATFLGLKPTTLEIWRCQGRGLTFKKFGRAVRYSVEDLNSWIENQTRSNTCQN